MPQRSSSQLRFLGTKIEIEHPHPHTQDLRAEDSIQVGLEDSPTLCCMFLLVLAQTLPMLGLSPTQPTF